MKLALGDQIPLRLQLSDGAAGMFPRAVVYKADGTIHATADLAHIANGLYGNTAQTMPNSAYVSAVYLVYSDAGHTTLAGYVRTVDTWQLAAGADGLTLGSQIPLQLELSDGLSTMYPRAVLYKADGTVHATVDLAHVANGLYENDAQTMPSSAYVSAVYIVYSDAGHTTLAPYQRSIETWQLGAGGGALTPPTISNITPNGAVPGEPGAFTVIYSRARLTPITFDLTDIAAGSKITITVKFGNRSETYVALDADGQWRWPFDLEPNNSIGALGVEPVHVTLLPRGGWPSTSVTFQVAAVKAAIEP